MRKTICLLAALAVTAAWSSRPERSVSFEGTWRAVLVTPGGELPFTLRITRSDGGLKAVVVNGPEKVPVSAVSVEGSAIAIRFDWYDSAIAANLSGDGRSLTGTWTRTGPSGLSHIPFRATLGAQPRFPAAPDTSPGAASTLPGNVTGIWKAEFVDSAGVSPARGELQQEQDSSRVVGTFLTPTGDYRYLEGSYERGLLRLSTFDGAHAFLFQGRASSDGRLTGDYWSRDSYHATWTATRTDDLGARLPDGWKDVGLTNSAGHLAFRFPDLSGAPVALSDARFRGKVVIVNLFGSWCPNCNDEAPLLAELDRRYRHEGLAIVGLAYEFTGDPARDREMVRRFARRHDIRYPLLLAGVSDKAKASATLPDLTAVLAYPTSIFIGRDGAVKKIYSGFSGPGTGRHYEELRKEIESLIRELLRT